MPMVFPTSPTVGQVFTESGRSWVWSGSSWDSPTAVNVLQVPIGLDLIKTQAIGTAVSSVTVSDVFSEKYEAYKIIVSGGAATENQNMRLQIGNAATGYYTAGQIVTYAGVTGPLGVANGTRFTHVGYGGTNTLSMNADIINPFQAKRTTYSSARMGPQVGSDFVFSGGFLDNNNSYTDFTISTTLGTYTGGTIYVYGYKKA